MDINWRAVLVGFLTALVAGLFVVAIVPPGDLSGVAQAIPGLLGGFVAGYLVSGAREGAVHGGLATIVGGIVVLGTWLVMGTLFAGVVPAIAGLVVGVVVLVAQAIPGAIAGAVGGWTKGRRATAREPAGGGRKAA
jgi:hypothetical protein